MAYETSSAMLLNHAAGIGARNGTSYSYSNKKTVLCVSFGMIPSNCTLVKPDLIREDEVSGLADDIASKIRQELTFPGEVRITIVRESKYVDYAT